MFNSNDFVRPSVDFRGAILGFFKNFVVFTGRANKSEFWWVMIPLFIIHSFLFVVMSTIGSNSDHYRHLHDGDPYNYFGDILFWSGTLLFVVLLIPVISLTVRRLHDVNKEGWWAFLYLIPIVGELILIGFLTQDSKVKGVRFDGPVPPWHPLDGSTFNSLTNSGINTYNYSLSENESFKDNNNDG